MSTSETQAPRSMVMLRIVVLLGVSSLIAAVGCDKYPSYIGMLKHDKQYYAAIAAACDALLAQTNSTSSLQILKGNDKSLPKALLDLHATTIKVANHVRMGTDDVSNVEIVFRWGQSDHGNSDHERPDYTMGWAQFDHGNGHRPWQLVIVGEGTDAVLFTKPGTGM